MKRRWIRFFIYSAPAVVAVFRGLWAAFEWKIRAKTEQTRVVVEGIKGRFSDQCQVGMDAKRGEGLLSSLGFSHSYVPRVRFYYGNLLEVLSAVPPSGAEEYVIGTTDRLGSYGLYDVYMTALMFLDEDRRVLSCSITARLSGL